MSQYNVHFDTIVNRKRFENWSENQKILYFKQTTNKTIVFKRIIKLKQTHLWQIVNFENKKILKHNTKKTKLNYKLKKKLHDNAKK